MKIVIILGTRPEIIKMAPIIDNLNKHKDDCIVIHTGQHYDKEMSEQFFIDLQLPRPDYNIGVGSNTAITQLNQMIKGLEEILTKENPDVVLVQGDTNAVLAGAISANKLSIPLAHVEAGLRSFDKSMPEEINRLIADDCSKLFFVPTEETGINLLNEGYNHKSIFVTGNSIVDACKRNLKIAEKENGIQNELKFEEYIILTSHRAENVDNVERLRSIVKCILDLPYNIVFPIHPHTLKLLKKINLYESIIKSDHIQITKPLGYLDFLYLLSNCSLVLTDSGGVQEEAVTLNIPCVTLRYNTERPETVENGSNILVGTNYNEIISTVKNIMENEEVYISMSNTSNPYGDGNTAEHIYNILFERFNNDNLKISSPTSIREFKGYKLENIFEDITVKEYLEKYDYLEMEQVFYKGKPEFINDSLNLKNRTIIIREFKIIQ